MNILKEKILNNYFEEITEADAAITKAGVTVNSESAATASVVGSNTTRTTTQKTSISKINNGSYINLNFQSPELPKFHD